MLRKPMASKIKQNTSFSPHILPANNMNVTHVMSKLIKNENTYYIIPNKALCDHEGLTINPNFSFHALVGQAISSIFLNSHGLSHSGI